MKTVIRIVPVTLIMGTIFFLSHQSGDSLQLPSFPGVDKLAHMIAYATLAVSVLWLFYDRALDNPRRTAVVMVLFCVFYGISDEYHQSFIALRSVSIFDLLADTMGALLVATYWLRSSTLRQQIIKCQGRVRALGQHT